MLFRGIFTARAFVEGKEGGALRQMLLPFRLGLGGTVGNGSQAFSWIHISDLARAFQAAMDNGSFEGVYNLCSPGPTTNKGLTKALSSALKRPAFLRVPEFLLKLQYGQGAGVLTKGQTVYPKRLTEAGFKFVFTDIDEAVRDCIN